MGEKEIIVKATPFPKYNATDAEKQSKTYGLQVAKAIEGEWFKRSGNGCRFYDRYADYHSKRLYARGEQPVEMYQDLFKVNGDNSWLNLDWSIVKIAPKFVDIVVNGINNRGFAIKAQSEDISSAEKKNIFQEMVEADMYAKDFLKQTKDQFGIDAYNVNPEEIPESDEEMSLYMQLKYKPSIEIAAEISINTILEQNGYIDSIKPLVDYDITVIGKGAIRHNFKPGEGVVIEYVDPALLVHSYTDKRDHSDCFYFGDVKTVHYTELRKIDPTLTDEQIAEMKATSSMWYRNYPEAYQYSDDAFADEMINLLFFSYKTEKRFVFKKKNLGNGGARVIRRDESFVPDPEGDGMFERKDIIKDVWYEGVLVLGTKYLIDWKLQKNMVRPESPSGKVYSNYIVNAPRMYRGQEDSTLSRMIPFLNQIQLIHLKLQQVASRVNPNGIYIDADGLVDVDLGNGKTYSPSEALNLYFQTGTVIGRSNTTDGDFNNARVPIQELNSNSGNDKISSLINMYNYNLNMIRDCTGLNEARDGSNPDDRGLVGLQKMAAAQSNVATRHILDGGIDITKRLATSLSLRISDILEYADFRDEFAMQVGKYNLAIMNDIKNLPLHSFGIFIELEPDEEEKAKLEENIQIALSKGNIELEDAIDIRTIKNVKLANEMLKVKKRNKLKAMQKREDEQSAIQMQINMQSQQAAAEQRMQLAQAEAQSKIAVEQARHQFEMEKMQAEVQAKEYLMSVEFSYESQLRGMETDNLSKREKAKEDAKDKRVDLQATRQSELIEQRQKGLPAKNFESSNDSLGDFDLESFMPR